MVYDFYLEWKVKLLDLGQKWHYPMYTSIVAIVLRTDWRGQGGKEQLLQQYRRNDAAYTRVSGDKQIYFEAETDRVCWEVFGLNKWMDGGTIKWDEKDYERGQSAIGVGAWDIRSSVLYIMFEMLSDIQRPFQPLDYT
jgi:hypothetical protein